MTEFFQLQGLEPQKVRQGIWQVYLPVETARVLGACPPREGWMQYTFSRALAEQFGASLMLPGSLRFECMRQAIRQRGFLTAAALTENTFDKAGLQQKLFARLDVRYPQQRHYLVTEGSIMYPYLAVTLRVDRVPSLQCFRIAVLVDLISGAFGRNRIPNGLLRDGCAPNMIKPQLSLSHAYRRGQQAALACLTDADWAWYQQADSDYRTAVQRLETVMTSAEPDACSARLEETRRRLCPRIQMRLERGCLVSIPRFNYRLLAMPANSRTERMLVVECDPVLNHWNVVDGSQTSNAL